MANGFTVFLDGRQFCRSRTFLLLGITLLLPIPSVAQQSYSFTKEEYQSLPRYCQAQVFIAEHNPYRRISESERASWKAELGPGYVHLHHFCRALISMRRAAQSTSVREQNVAYNRAIRDFNYVLLNVERDFVLLPEIHLRKGLAFRVLGDDVAATKEFTTAIRVKPDYTPAYVALVDYFLDLGELEEAERVLDLGLARAPTSKLLKGKRDEIKARQDAPSSESS